MAYSIVVQISSAIANLVTGASSGSSSVQQWSKSNCCFLDEKFEAFTFAITLCKSFLYTLFLRWMSVESPAIYFSNKSSLDIGSNFLSVVLVSVGKALSEYLFWIFWILDLGLSGAFKIDTVAIDL